jgi:hypothetical protein
VYFLGKFWDLFERNSAILQSAVHKNLLFAVFGDLNFKDPSSWYQEKVLMKALAPETLMFGSKA